MKTILRNLLLAVLILLMQTTAAKAQAFDDAGQYMDHISKANEKLTAVYLSYTSALAHKNARKQEKRRSDVLNAIIDTKAIIMGMPPWKGDRSYKDSTAAYLKLLNIVFNEDYAKIVNMEEIAEQSYDAMEAYLLAQEKADEKLEEARVRQHNGSLSFAKKNNINLIEGESEIGRKSKIVSDLNKHCNDVYLVFFKPYKQEMYLLDALQKGNLIAIEQNINSLEKFTKEGEEKLKTFEGFNSDPSLIAACQEALVFYQSESTRTKNLSDFFLKKENFDKMKKAFDAKRNNDRTKTDIDNFNNSVNEMNAASKDYNKLNDQLNKERTAMLNNWNKKYGRYLEEHMPVQRKQ
ncbi:MAG: hypothetical protein IPI78_11540 [Chitinophagaceae bacterium]|nr:hypothetical protein [Chitinophagaceae bacterium]